MLFNLFVHVKLCAPIVVGLAQHAALRAVENLLSNAVKYSEGDLFAGLTPTGGDDLPKKARLTQTEAQWLSERFYTVEICLSSAGLGLSVAKLLTEKMHGTIGADCASGMLTLRVWFPTVKE